MTKRILFWNIENFGLNKINDPGQGRQPGTITTRAIASNARLLHIMSNIVAAAPDIFVVVEIETGYDAPGRLVRGAGRTGAITLLNAIRVATGNVNWMLVPPLQTGPNEGVAVYYDSTNLIFTGPHIWPGGAGATAQPAGGMSGAYPPALTAVVGARNVPANALQNVGVAENQCAARVDFTYNANNVANAGNAIPYVGRAPYMVTFAEMNAAMPPVVTRNITIFAVHSPASNPAAGNYLQELADTAEITAANAPNEVRVVAGDFNVNLMTAALVQNGNYAPMQAGLAAYTLALAPVAPAPALPANGYIGYFATHIKRRRSAVYWSTNNLTTYYPGYGYIGSDRIVNFIAIDNIFTRYAGGMAIPAPNNFTIINPFSGSPFNLNGPPVGGAPPGTVAYAPVLAPAMMFNPPPALAPAFSIQRRQIFYNWTNYGYVRSTSDHLALMMDI
ncbi:MAG TPA: hypothetical protein VF527_00285 [Pyrinomonadaceae bacterium]|jgi:hypothetical protein